MGVMKKRWLQGMKSPRYSVDRLVRPKVVQLDLFEGCWFYHDREMFYVSQEEDVKES